MKHGELDPRSSRNQGGVPASSEVALERLAALTAGLLLISESDHPLRAVRLGATTESELPNLLRAEVSRSDAGVQCVQLDAFFERATRTQPYHTDQDRLVVERYRRLVSFLANELTSTRVYRIGDIDVDVYVLGQSLEGEWLGVATKLIET